MHAAVRVFCKDRLLKGDIASAPQLQARTTGNLHVVVQGRNAGFGFIIPCEKMTKEQHHQVTISICTEHITRLSPNKHIYNGHALSVDDLPAVSTQQVISGVAYQYGTSIMIAGDKTSMQLLTQMPGTSGCFRGYIAVVT